MKKILLIAILLTILIPNVADAYRSVYSASGRQGSGAVVPSSTITLYLAGGVIPAYFYTTTTTDTSVNSTTADSNGEFVIYIDKLVYGDSQKFKIVISKTGYTSVTRDQVDIDSAVLGTYTLSGTTTVSKSVSIPQGVVYNGTMIFTVQPRIGDYQVFDVSSTITGFDSAWPQWWGTGATAVNLAVASVYNSTSGRYGTVALSGRDYTVTTSIDASIKHGLTIDFKNDARMICQTGDASPCITVIGSNDLTLNNPNLYMPTASYSTIGILGGYNNTSTSGQFHTRIINPKITWQTWTNCPSANSSMGVVGIAMIGGENIDINNSNIQANIPILLSSIPTVAWLEGTASAFDFRTVDSKLPASWTQGHVSLSGKQVLQAMGKHRASLEMYNVNNVTMEAGYTGSPAADPATDGTYLVGIHQTTGQNNKLHWLAEGQDTALRMVTDYNSTFDYQIASPVTSKPSAVLYGGGGYVVNSTVNAMVDASNTYSFGIDTSSPFTGTFTGNVWRSTQSDTAKVWDASLAVLIPIGFNVVTGQSTAWNTRDFRTGTITAGLTAGTSGTITLSDASLMYTTYGSEVAIRGMLIVDSVSSPVGELTLTGLPLAVGAGNKNYAPIAIYAHDMNATATTTLFGYAVPGASTIVVKHFAAGTAADAAADIKAGTVLMINGTYSQ